ncbi:MAG: hypothetical protein DSM106950_23200 [Stigonema ocellatum SAG 48.90 = DSM 106950]|nr:hypothetical protein [Stigonema ocellatum SAG 48.90 = DSM 106950]
MKNHTIKIRVSERRLNKLRLYSAWADKTMTSVLEELIDSLPIPEDGKNSNALYSVVATQQNK